MFSRAKARSLVLTTAVAIVVAMAAMSASPAIAQDQSRRLASPTGAITDDPEVIIEYPIVCGQYLAFGFEATEKNTKRSHLTVSFGGASPEYGLAFDHPIGERLIGYPIPAGDVEGRVTIRTSTDGGDRMLNQETYLELLDTDCDTTFVTDPLEGFVSDQPWDESMDVIDVQPKCSARISSEAVVVSWTNTESHPSVTAVLFSFDSGVTSETVDSALGTVTFPISEFDRPHDTFRVLLTWTNDNETLDLNCGEIIIGLGGGELRITCSVDELADGSRLVNWIANDDVQIGRITGAIDPYVIYPDVLETRPASEDEWTDVEQLDDVYTYYVRYLVPQDIVAPDDTRWRKCAMEPLANVNPVNPDIYWAPVPIR